VIEGDVLVAVDGTPVVRDEPLLLTGTRVRGPLDTVVRLGIRRRHGFTLELPVARAQVRSRTVLPAGTNVWRILVFEPGTAQELRDALGKVDPASPVILDLRGNPGGSLAGAVESARLFLAKEANIVDVRMRATTLHHAGREDAPFLTSPAVVLWQDRLTASAAEVFIAALTRNARALSIGQTTYGKGVTQRTTELVNGGALIFTDGWLVPPDGKEYHGAGLGPDFPVAGSATVAYREATRRVFERLAAPPTPASSK
jgi:carboxyl-terminal processing protease